MTVRSPERFSWGVILAGVRGYGRLKQLLDQPLLAFVSIAPMGAGPEQIVLPAHLPNLEFVLPTLNPGRRLFCACQTG